VHTCTNLELETYLIVTGSAYVVSCDFENGFISTTTSFLSYNNLKVVKVMLHTLCMLAEGT